MWGLAVYWGGRGAGQQQGGWAGHFQLLKLARVRALACLQCKAWCVCVCMCVCGRGATLAETGDRLADTSEACAAGCKEAHTHGWLRRGAHPWALFCVAGCDEAHTHGPSFVWMAATRRTPMGPLLCGWLRRGAHP
eukprot:354238-Chlamydomonas_euryale.AAC.1